jgi:hypothetical protein
MQSTMSRTAARKKKDEVADLKERIAALPPEDQIRLMDEAITPTMHFHAVSAKLREKVKHVAPRELGREIDRAVREVRRDRARKTAR